MSSGLQLVRRPLEVVPQSPLPAGPQVCVAVLEDAAHGLLTAQWLSLASSLNVLETDLAHLRRRAVTSAAACLGVFDYEGLALDSLEGKSLAQLQWASRRGHRTM